jgi:hypothetical protein
MSTVPNPAAMARRARIVPIPRRPDGRLEPTALDAALQHGLCIVRWHLGQ